MNFGVRNLGVSLWIYEFGKMGLNPLQISFLFLIDVYQIDKYATLSNY